MAPAPADLTAGQAKADEKANKKEPPTKKRKTKTPTNENRDKCRAAAKDTEELEVPAGQKSPEARGAPLSFAWHTCIHVTRVMHVVAHACSCLRKFCVC